MRPNFDLFCRPEEKKHLIGVLAEKTGFSFIILSVCFDPSNLSSGETEARLSLTLSGSNTEANTIENKTNFNMETHDFRCLLLPQVGVFTEAKER